MDAVRSVTADRERERERTVVTSLVELWISICMTRGTGELYDIWQLLVLLETYFS